MASSSKKYMIQPLTPPRQQRRSSALSILAKYANSTGKSEKKRIVDHPVPTLPFAPYPSPFDLDSYGHLNSPRTARVESPHDLETDLRVYREYCKRTEDARSSLESYSATTEDDDEETASSTDTQSEPTTPTNDAADDFASWRRDMNSKLATKKRQIRSEKRRVRKEGEQTASSSSSSSSASSSSSSSPHKQKYTIFQIGKAKGKEKEKEKEKKEETAASDTFMSMHGLITSVKEDTKSSSKNLSRHKKCASESGMDSRLFQTVRTASSIEQEEEEANASANKTKPMMSLSLSLSLSPRRSGSPTPAARMSPRRSGSPTPAARISPRHHSPAKISPRSHSPTKLSPRGEPTKISPRGEPTEQYSAGDSHPYPHTLGVGGGGGGAKRVPRNAVSVAIAT